MPHEVRDVAVNPNNSAQRYILWTNGRIDNIGGAPPITGPGWYDRLDTVAMALHITDWVAGKGYVLDWQGGFNPLGGAPDLMTDNVQYPLKSVPGVEYVTFRCYIDWSWDPAGTGQGYVLDLWGRLYAFGGATAPPRTGSRFIYDDARRLVMQWSPVKQAVTMDLHGGLYGDFGLNLPTNLGNWYSPTQDAARDVFVTDWVSNPIKGYTLDLHGETHAWGGASISGAPGGVWQNADVARSLYLLSPSNPVRMWQVWAGGQQFEYLLSNPPTVTAGGGASDVQKVTITGAPTGGTFTLSLGGQTTAAIARTATAATVQTALTALSTIGAGNATVTGGPGPTTPWTVTFGGALALTDVAQMTATSSLTGGTSPTVTVSTVNSGVVPSPPSSVTTTSRPDLTWVYTDPQSDSQATWQLLAFTQAFVNGHTMTDPLAWASSALIAQEGNQRTARGITSPIDLANGAYRYYVRAQDTAGQWSAWSNRGWTQAIVAPATPTGLTATANQTAMSVALSVSATVGNNADLVRFEYSTDGGTTWQTVRGASAVLLGSTTTATDPDIAAGQTRLYRATAYATSPAIASAPSSTATATLTARNYALTSTASPSLGGVFSVQDPVEWTRPVVADAFTGIGAPFVTVVSDGVPKGRQTTLRIITESAAEWDRLEAVVESDAVLVYRDPFGEVIYCRLIGDWTRTQLPAAPLPGDVTPLRHVHTTQLPLVEVAKP